MLLEFMETVKLQTLKSKKEKTNLWEITKWERGCGFHGSVTPDINVENEPKILEKENVAKDVRDGLCPHCGEVR